MFVDLHEPVGMCKIGTETELKNGLNLRKMRQRGWAP